jgi:hypothetical protein
VLIELVWVLAARVNQLVVEDSLITKSSRPELDSLSHRQMGGCLKVSKNKFTHFSEHFTTDS